MCPLERLQHLDDVLEKAWARKMLTTPQDAHPSPVSILRTLLRFQWVTEAR
jgi:hypothetical protein